jgi:hypothetical protein
MDPYERATQNYDWPGWPELELFFWEETGVLLRVERRLCMWCLQHTRTERVWGGTHLLDDRGVLIPNHTYRDQLWHSCNYWAHLALPAVKPLSCDRNHSLGLLSLEKTCVRRIKPHLQEFKQCKELIALLPPRLGEGTIYSLIQEIGK